MYGCAKLFLAHPEVLRENQCLRLRKLPERTLKKTGGSFLASHVKPDAFKDADIVSIQRAGPILQSMEKENQPCTHEWDPEGIKTLGERTAGSER